MRLAALLLAIACLQVSATGLAQKVTLHEQGASLKKIFKEIKQQTGYVFFYKAGLLDNSRPVTIEAKDEELPLVLEKCFRDQPLNYNIVNKTIVVSPRQAASVITPVPPIADSVPEVVVSGRITDRSGKPLAAASVSVKGRHGVGVGTSTDKDGLFRILVAKGSTLVISYVGYIPQELKVKADGQPLAVQLTEGAKESMSNMVVTGYQMINKESFTGTAVTVSGEELKKVNPNNVLQSLQAFDPSFNIATNNLAGSNPNQLPSINVRGSTALPTSSSAVLSRTDLSSNVNLPTFILDGYEVSLEKVYDLDVNRIQSITLLKDAAATAVYGSRAANGVMVIITKAPKEGKLSVYYNYELTPSAPDLSAYHVLNASQKLQYESLAGLYTASNSLQNQDQLDQAYYQKKLAVISGVNTDWLAQPLQNGFGQKHSMFVEGGTPQVRYGIDLQYQTAPGVMKGSGRDRYGLAVDLSYSPTSKFIFKNVLSVQQVNSKESPYGSFADYVRMNPYYPKTDSLGHIVQSVDTWIQDRGLSGNQYQYTQVLNPMFESTLGSINKSAYLEFTDNFSAEWNIARGLRLRSVISYDRKNSTWDYFVSPLSNQFYFYPPNYANQKGYYYYAAKTENTFDGSMTLNYNQQLGSQFFNVALGANARTYSTDFKSFEAVGFASDQFSNIGFAASYYPGHTPVGDYSQQRLIGSFLNVNYSWLNKYLLDLSVRADGSSLFGENNRVAPSWAAGIGWNVHKEDFFRNPVISQLRLRAGTGLTGSVSFPPYMAQTTYNYYSTNWYTTGVGAVTNNYGNENLKWQQTHDYDAGMDLGLFKDRIIISPRYYYKLTKGMLADIQLPPSAGFSSYTDNLGDMANKGWELNFKVTAYHNRDWNVSVFANLVHNTNVIKKISNSLTSYNDKANQAQQKDSSLRTTPLLHYQEGQAVNEIYAVRSLGIDPENGKEIFVKKNGTHSYTYDVNDIAPLADPTPKVQGSFGTALSYKGFQFNTTFITTIGGKDYNQTLADRVDDANPRYNVDSRALSDRWKHPGDHAQFKGISDLSVTYPTSRFIQNLSTLDLSSVYLSYDFSKRVYSRMAMKNLRISLTANEVFFWSTEKIERGIDYPYARSFTFSIQTSF